MATRMNRGKGKAPSLPNPEIISQTQAGSSGSQLGSPQEPDPVQVQMLAMLERLQGELLLQRQQSEIQRQQFEIRIQEIAGRHQSPVRSPRSHSRHEDSPLPSRERQRRNREETVETARSFRSSYRKPRDIQTLSNGQDPTFESWKIQLHGQFNSFPDQWPTEADRKLYVFRSTTSTAQLQLEPRMKENSLMPFETVDEMLESLDAIFSDENEATEMRIEYHALMMGEKESFADFRTNFLRLADGASIPLSERLSDIFQKLEPSLQLQVNPIKDDLRTLSEFMRRTHSIYQANQHIKERLRRQSTRKASMPFSPQGTKAPHPSSGQLQTPTAAPAPARYSTPAFPVPTGRSGSTLPREKVKGNCYNCGQPDHYALACPEPRKPSTDVKLMELSELGVLPATEEEVSTPIHASESENGEL